MVGRSFIAFMFISLYPRIASFTVARLFVNAGGSRIMKS